MFYTEYNKTKFITNAQFKKELKKNEKDCFILCITTKTILSIEKEIKEEDNKNKTEKQKRFLTTDLETFKNNPAYWLLKEYQNTLFRPKLPTTLPPRRETDIDIEVKDKNKAMYRSQFRLSPEQKEEVNKWVKDMIRAGIIRPSRSPHAAPTFSLKKPVGWRIVHDYRQLNSNTIRLSTPLIRKEDISDKFQEGKYFTCMDLLSAYYQ